MVKKIFILSLLVFMTLEMTTFVFSKRKKSKKPSYKACYTLLKPKQAQRWFINLKKNINRLENQINKNYRLSENYDLSWERRERHKHKYQTLQKELKQLKGFIGLITVRNRYSKLMCRIKVNDKRKKEDLDATSVSGKAYYDYGYMPAGNDYGYKNLPAGWWIYVNGCFYIWGSQDPSR